MTGWRGVSVIVVTAVTALALAAAARYGLIEPADVTARCDGGAIDNLCQVRAWTIQSFVHQRIGWAALGLALVATVTGWRSVAAIALFAACSGLILYTTELCAPAALLALLVFIRKTPRGQPAAPANTISKQQYDKA